jgi:hypothetical protein
MLPESLVAPLQDHLRSVERLHEEDLARGFGAVCLPYALERKYPNANREWMKVLYDNAQLARVYLHAWQVTGELFSRTITEEILDYIMREVEAGRLHPLPPRRAPSSASRMSTTHRPCWPSLRTDTGPSRWWAWKGPAPSPPLYCLWLTPLAVSYRTCRLSPERRWAEN